MANQKLTDRNLMNEQLHDDDVIHIVDVSDTTDSAEGTSKKWKILTWLRQLFAPKTSPEFTGDVTLENNKWLKSKDYSGAGYINILKGNEDDEVDVAAQLNVGAIEADPDAGEVALFDMPVTSASTDGTEMSVAIRIDANDILKVGAKSDGVGGIDGLFVKNYGANIQNITVVNISAYTILEKDNIIHSTYSATEAQTITIPTAQLVSGRIIVIKDAGGNASVKNITVGTEGDEKIDGSDTAVINSNYGVITLYSNGSNWFKI